MESAQTVDKAILNQDSEDVYIRNLMQSLVGLTRLANNLPSAEGMTYSALEKLSFCYHVLLIQDLPIILNISRHLAILATTWVR